MKKVNAGVISFSLAYPDLTTFVTADFSISIFTLSATFTVTVVSFTLVIIP